MEALELKTRIDSLDPVTHGALRERLIARYRQLSGGDRPQLDSTVQENKITQPYLDYSGTLVIPFSSDRRYHWWNGGQSIAETLKEIEGKLKFS